MKKPTKAQLMALWRVCEAWRDRYEPSCAEALYQTDRCVIAATELTEAACEIIGYYKDTP